MRLIRLLHGVADASAQHTTLAGIDDVLTLEAPPARVVTVDRDEGLFVEGLARRGITTLEVIGEQLCETLPVGGVDARGEGGQQGPAVGSVSSAIMATAWSTPPTPARTGQVRQRVTRAERDLGRTSRCRAASSRQVGGVGSHEWVASDAELAALVPAHPATGWRAALEPRLDCAAAIGTPTRRPRAGPARDLMPELRGRARSASA